MALIAKPITTSYKNLGEKYKLGIKVVDDDGEAVDVTGDVTLRYTVPDGSTFEEEGTADGNEAYYLVDSTSVNFLVSGTFKYWILCFDGDIYGPFELKIMDVPEISS